LESAQSCRSVDLYDAAVQKPKAVIQSGLKCRVHEGEARRHGLPRGESEKQAFD
jgi:hypothetical protein